MSSASLYSVTAYCFAQPRSASSAAATKCLTACSSSPAPRQWRRRARPAPPPARRYEILASVLELAAPAPVAGERRSGLADLGCRRLDELGDVAMAPAPAGARLEVVRDVANEDVLERPLHVSLDPRNRVSVDQVAPLERGKDGAEAVGVARDALERALPEDPADDRGVEDDLPLLGRERV